MRVSYEGKTYEVWGHIGGPINVMPAGEQDRKVGWSWSSGREIGYGWAVRLLELAEGKRT